MPNPETPLHPAEVAQEFMSRCDLKGREVEAYAQTHNWLETIRDEKVVLVAAAEYAKLKAAFAAQEAALFDNEEIPTLALDSSMAELDAVG